VAEPQWPASRIAQQQENSGQPSRDGSASEQESGGGITKKRPPRDEGGRLLC